VGRGLQVHAIGPRLGIGLAYSLTATAVAVGASWAAYGSHAAWISAYTLGPLGLVTALAGHALAVGRGRLGGLRRQFGAVAVLALAVLAMAVALFVWAMFASGHDAFFTALVAAYAAALGFWVSREVGRSALGDLDAVRRTLQSVADGRRDVRTGVEGADELAALARDVDGMITRLDSEERMRRSLIAAVSHDLRTPITSLQLIAEAIDDEILEPEARREYIKRMSTHVRSLSALIDDLFELTRLETQEIRWSFEQVELGALVEETIEAMRPAADASSVAVRAELPATAAIARANPEQLQRVLFNLVQNAIRHTPADGSVTIRTERVNGGVEVEIADTGDGIEPADRERVFEPFFQGGDRAARTDGGAGLGLAIARAIVEAHGGRIWLEDAERGTRVRFMLPAGV
jgi:signal transduction histidine kinase